MRHLLLAAQETAIEITGPDYDFWAEFARMMLILGLIIVVLAGLAWVLKKVMHTRMEQLNKVNEIKVLEHRILGQKSALYLLEISGKRLVIGESPAGLHPLTELPEASDAARDFESVLKQRVENPPT